MECVYEKGLLRDLKKYPQADKEFAKAVLAIKSAPNAWQVAGAKKMQGTPKGIEAYRVKAGDFRLCFYDEGDTARIVRFLPRKDVYKVFP